MSTSQSVFVGVFVYDTLFMPMTAEHDTRLDTMLRTTPVLD